MSWTEGVPVAAIPRGAVLGLARRGGRRAPILPAVWIRPRRQEARIGCASHCHTSRSRPDSSVTMGRVHRQCQSLPHVKESFGLARGDERRAPAVSVAATRQEAARTRPRRREARTAATRHEAVRTRRRRQEVRTTATRRGAVRTRPRRWEACTGSAGRRHTSRSRLDSPATMGGAH